MIGVGAMADDQEQDYRDAFERMRKAFPELTYEAVAEYLKQQKGHRAFLEEYVEDQIAQAKKLRGRPRVSSAGVELSLLKKIVAVKMKDRGESNRSIAAYLHETKKPTGSQIRNVAHQVKEWRKTTEEHFNRRWRHLPWMRPKSDG